jgi:hypothetical protein
MVKNQLYMDMSSTLNQSQDSQFSHTNTLVDAAKKIFNMTSLIFLVCFLVVYFGLYYALGKTDGSNLLFSRAIDFLIIIIVIAGIIHFVTKMKPQEKQHFITYCIQESGVFFDDPISLFLTIITILIFYLIIYVCGIPMTPETKPFTISIIEHKLWICVVLLLFFYLFRFGFGINLSDYIFEHILIFWEWLTNEVKELRYDDADTDTDSVDDDVDKKDASSNSIVSKTKLEVFNISNNLYTYDDAQAVCKALDSRLASYNEVESAYIDGGEWCNYGWSQDQMALFPTQKQTWDTLQQSPTRKNSCGRPGVNGGYMENTQLKFGINCYGVKPNASKLETASMIANKDVLHPKTKEDVVLDAKVNYWKQNKDQMLVLNPFNRNKWSEY